MEYATTYLTQFVTTEERIAVFASKVIDEVKEGIYNPLEIKLHLTALKQAIEQIDKGISESVLTEAQKYGEKSFAFKGAKVTIKEQGTRYDYSECGDIDWEILDSEIKSRDARRKEREKFLQGLKEKMTAVNESTGEVYEIHPPKKKSTTGLSISFK